MAGFKHSTEAWLDSQKRYLNPWMQMSKQGTGWTGMVEPSNLRLFSALTGCLCDPTWPRESQILWYRAGEVYRHHLKGGGRYHGTDNA